MNYAICPYYMRKCVEQQSGWINVIKNVSDVTRHRSGTGKSSQTISDVGSERCYRVQEGSAVQSTRKRMAREF
jgi:hypothetical protein